MRHPPWQTDVLAQGELYRVGGSVRDALLGATGAARRSTVRNEDFLVRGLPPEQLEVILRRHGRLQLVGKSFGVYKFRPTGETVEYDIAYPRKERSTGPGHRDFAVQWDWRLAVEDDLARRDFTINAIAQNVKDGRVVDPCGGRADIDRRVLRMIFPQAFGEDPLRILRGVRFAACFGLAIDEPTFNAMAAASAGLAALSAERVQEEFTKLLTECERPSVGLEHMRRLGALAVLFPELNRTFGVTQNEYHPDDVYWHTLRTCDAAPADHLVVRWAALLHDLGKVDKKQVLTDDAGERVVFYGHEEVSAEFTDRVLRRLRYGTDFIDACRTLVAHHMFDYRPEWNASTIRRFIRRVGEKNLENLFLLREADCRSRGLDDEVRKLDGLRQRIHAEFAARGVWKVEDLAIDGEDVMQLLGIGPGPRVGEALQAVLERVLEDPALNTRERLIEILRGK
jgi:tRNA nucleotidyltransferase (CCA-adding enzyme)